MDKFKIWQRSAWDTSQRGLGRYGKLCVHLCNPSELPGTDTSNGSRSNDPFRLQLPQVSAHNLSRLRWTDLGLSSVLLEGFCICYLPRCTVIKAFLVCPTYFAHQKSRWHLWIREFTLRHDINCHIPLRYCTRMRIATSVIVSDFSKWNIQQMMHFGAYHKRN